MKLILLFAVGAALLCSVPSFADIKSDMTAGMPLEQLLSNNLPQDSSFEKIKSSITEIVQMGGDEGKVVELGIKSGYDAQAVIAGAVAGGGELRRIVLGALAAGLSPERVAVLCKDAGADPETVASILASISSGEDLYGYGYADSGRQLGSIPSGGAGGGGADVSKSR